MVISPLRGQLSGCSAFNAEGMAALSFLFLLFIVQNQVTFVSPGIAPCFLHSGFSAFARLSTNLQYLLQQHHPEFLTS